MQKKLLFAFLLTTGVGATAIAQPTPYVLLGHHYDQDFNSLASGLPTGWEVYRKASLISEGTAVSFTTAATPWANGAGTFANYASMDTFYANATAAMQNASPNRALGVKGDITLDSGMAFQFRVHDTKGLSSMQLSFKFMSLDLAAAKQTSWLVDYKLAGDANFTPLTGFFNTGNNLFNYQYISANLPPVVNDQDSQLIIRVVAYLPSTGLVTWPTSAIDSFRLMWTGKPPVTVAYDSTNIPCTGGQTGSITNIHAAGGLPPFTYALDSVAPNAPVFGNQVNFVGLYAGTHTISVKDSDGTVTYFPVNLTEPAFALGVNSYWLKDVTCKDGANGWAGAEAFDGVAPYQYSWDGAAYGPFKTAADTILTLAAGQHVITVRDTNNCVAAANFFINEPDSVDADFTVTDAFCFGGEDGSIVITNTSGGASSSSYTYSWSVPGTDSFLTDLNAGNYTSTITDDSGCMKTTVLTVSSPTKIVLGIASATPDAGNCTGSMTVVATGGVPGYDYLWSTNSTAQTLSDMCAHQIYFLHVTDSRGCTVTDTLFVPALAVSNVAKADIELYPNPMHDFLFVKSPVTVNVVITDMIGNTVITATTAQQINVSALANGMYMINLYDEKNQLIDRKKIVKE